MGLRLLPGAVWQHNAPIAWPKIGRPSQTNVRAHDLASCATESTETGVARNNNAILFGRRWHPGSPTGNSPNSHCQFLVIQRRFRWIEARKSLKLDDTTAHHKAMLGKALHLSSRVLAAWRCEAVVVFKDRLVSERKCVALERERLLGPGVGI